ncbi:unnamed protein product [Lathyrus oleraceus]
MKASPKTPSGLYLCSTELRLKRTDMVMARLSCKVVRSIVAVFDLVFMIWLVDMF